MVPFQVGGWTILWLKSTRISISLVKPVARNFFLRNTTSRRAAMGYSKFVGILTAGSGIVLAASLPPIPSDLSTPAQQRLAIDGPGCT